MEFFGFFFLDKNTYIFICSYRQLNSLTMFLIFVAQFTASEFKCIYKLYLYNVGIIIINFSGGKKL